MRKTSFDRPRIGTARLTLFNVDGAVRVFSMTAGSDPKIGPLLAAILASSPELLDRAEDGVLRTSLIERHVEIVDGVLEVARVR